MVHRNHFYDTDLNNCDPKRELWRNTENVEVSKKDKIRFGVQNWTSEGCVQTKIIFKNILEVPALIPAQFSYIYIYIIFIFEQKYPNNIKSKTIFLYRIRYFYPLWVAIGFRATAPSSTTRSSTAPMWPVWSRCFRKKLQTWTAPCM